MEGSRKIAMRIQSPLFKAAALLFSTSSAVRATKITHKVFFDIAQGEAKLGRVTFGLYGETVPKTAEVSIHPSLYHLTSTRICGRLPIHSSNFIN